MHNGFMLSDKVVRVGVNLPDRQAVIALMANVLEEKDT